MAYLTSNFVKSDASVFLFRYLRNPANIGSVLPSSSGVCEEITSHLRKKRTPYRILEVGAGTGVITQSIARCLHREDVFDVVEIDSGFCKLIKSKVAKYDQIKVHCLSITDWQPGYSYDAIISTLPFNSLSPNLVQNVLDSYTRLTAQNGRLSYIEYIGLSDMKKIFLQGDDLERFLEIENTIADFQKKYCYDQRSVRIWRNFPPTYVHHFRMNSKESSSSESNLDSMMAF